MKKLLLFMSICLAFTACQRMNVLVDHDYRFSEKFNDYATYAFVECELDTNYFCSDVQQAIERQMAARGYKFNGQAANLYISFTVYNDRFQYKGYDQPQLVNWLVSRRQEDATYTPVKYQLGKGTLMISMIEASSSEVVWRGYATGIFNEDTQKKNYFKNVVRTIFDEYPLFAAGQGRVNLYKMEY